MLDTLRNFAEVGIAVAGFSAIVSALSSRSLNARERDHLVALLQTSGLVVAFALVPQVLATILKDPHTLWMAAGFFYFVVHLVHFGMTGSKMVRAVRSGRPDAIRKRDVYVLGTIASLLLLAQMGTVAFGYEDQMRFVYLLVLLWHTGIAMAMFGSLLVRAVSHKRKPSSSSTPDESMQSLKQR